MSYSRCRATDPRPSLMGYQARVSAVRRQVRGAMEIALFIQNIQVSAALLLVTCVRSVTCTGGEGGGGALHLHQPVHRRHRGSEGSEQVSALVSRSLRCRCSYENGLDVMSTKVETFSTPRFHSNLIKSRRRKVPMEAPLT